MDAQKEAYRKYLESAGVIDALTKGKHEQLHVQGMIHHWC